MAPEVDQRQKSYEFCQNQAISSLMGTKTPHFCVKTAEKIRSIMATPLKMVPPFLGHPLAPDIEEYSHYHQSTATRSVLTWDDLLTMMMILMMESSPITPANVCRNTDDVEHGGLFVMLSGSIVAPQWEIKGGRTQNSGFRSFICFCLCWVEDS